MRINSVGNALIEIMIFILGECGNKVFIKLQAVIAHVNPSTFGLVCSILFATFLICVKIYINKTKI